MAQPGMPEGFDDMTKDEQDAILKDLESLGVIDLPSTEKTDAEKEADYEAKKLRNAYRRMGEDPELKLVVDDLLDIGKYGECVFALGEDAARLTDLAIGRQTLAIYLKSKIEEACNG